MTVEEQLLALAKELLRAILLCDETGIAHAKEAARVLMLSQT